MKIGELFVELGFHADTMKLKEFTSALGELSMSSVMSVLGLGTLYESVKKIMGIADETALSINRFGATTGQNVQEFQRWDKWAQQMGAQAGTVSSSINTLEDSITKLMVTGEGAPTWSLLGIDPTKYRKNYVELLKVLGEKFKGTPIEWQRLMLQQLGLPLDLLMILPKIRDNWEDIQKQIAISNANLEIMAKFHQRNKELGDAIKDTFIGMAVNIEPLIEKLEIISKKLLDILGISKSLEEHPRELGKIKSPVEYLTAPVNPFLASDMLLSLFRGEGGLLPISKTSSLTTSSTSSLTTSSKSQVFNTTFNIDGSKDSQDIADQIEERWNRKFKNAEFNTPAGNY